MNIKNLMAQSTKRVNCFTIEDLKIDLVELSERDLQHISGGFCHCTCNGGGGGNPPGTVTITISGPNNEVTVVKTPSSSSSGSNPTTPACNCQPIKSSGGQWATLSGFDSIFDRY
jgi:hypothetical protein